MQRRKLLQAALSVGALVKLGACGGVRPEYRLFNPSEAETLSALLNQIIPDDETPGAVGANVMRFLDRQLARAYSGHRQAYRQGLHALDQCAIALEQKSFSALRFEQQEAMVERMEKGDLPAELWGGLSPREFFRTVRTHTMQGYYGDPRHGGNRDALSWRALGVPYPPVRGRDDYHFPKDPPEETPSSNVGRHRA